MRWRTQAVVCISGVTMHTWTHRSESAHLSRIGLVKVVHYTLFIAWCLSVQGSRASRCVPQMYMHLPYAVAASLPVKPLPLPVYYDTSLPRFACL